VKGFSLIELLMAMVVAGILAAIAVPNYIQYVTRGRIPDATAALSDLRVRAEQWFQDNRTYVGFDVPCGSTAGRHFNTACAGLTANAYEITATGKGTMAGFTYRITLNAATGLVVRSTPSVPAGWTSSTTCWVVKKSGSCI